MGIVAVPFTFSAGTVIVASEINSDYTTIYNEFNGNIDNTNIKAGANIDASKLLNSSITTGKIADAAITDAKIDYTSVRLLRSGTSNIGLKFARGGKAFTLAGGPPATATITITFSTDSDDGNPGFTVAPRVVAIAFTSTGTNMYDVKLTAVSNTAFTAEIRSNSGGADAISGTLHWMAVAL